MAISVKTLGVDQDAFILAIGVAFFNPEKGEIGLRRCFMPTANHGTANASTVWWWAMRAPKVLAQYTTYSAEMGTAMTWREISKTLSELIYGYGVTTLWASGIDFVFPVLETAFKNANVENPFNGLDRRDVRQWAIAAALAGWEAQERPREFPVHDALADAVWQSKEVYSIWSFLSKKGGTKHGN
jgi:hypothetical protein